MSRASAVDAVTKKFPHLGQLEELARALESKCNALYERNKELTEILKKAHSHILKAQYEENTYMQNRAMLVEITTALNKTV